MLQIIFLSVCGLLALWLVVQVMRAARAEAHGHGHTLVLVSGEHSVPVGGDRSDSGTDDASTTDAPGKSGERGIP
ncbi:MAG: hypothetical protein AB7K09_05000 [Planctomycetota bacterium]